MTMEGVHSKPRTSSTLINNAEKTARLTCIIDIFAILA